MEWKSFEGKQDLNVEYIQDRNLKPREKKLGKETRIVNRDTQVIAEASSTVIYYYTYDYWGKTTRLYNVCFLHK